jgi:hypothetical protein
MLLLMLTALMAVAALPARAADSAAPAAQYCWQPARLTAGAAGRVTVWPSLPNRLRSSPSYYGAVMGLIPAGGVFQVLSGPRCENGTNWWQVNYNGRVGWTAEGDGVTYWLEPYGSSPPPPPPTCQLPTRLSVGGQGRVTPGLPNVVRTAPGTQSTGAASVVIGQIPGGGVFSVLGGPQCGTDLRWWWLVNYNGLVGWTGEGEGGTYWVEPWSGVPAACPGTLPSRLTPGGFGAVTLYPYLPNRVRTAPDFGAYTVGVIPPGGVFQVLSGPFCNQNTAFWQVSYNGITGWTGEGDASTYWLEPR